MMAAADPQIGTPPEPQAPQAPPAAPAATANETVSRDEHQRELDRYRNQYGQEKKAREELEARLATLEEAGKTEAERLASKAAEAETLAPQLKAALKALTAQVESRLAELPEAMRVLVPEGDPITQLAWIEKAIPAAKAINPVPTLPAAGGRNPVAPPAPDDKRALEEAREMLPALQGLQPLRRGRS